MNADRNKLDWRKAVHKQSHALHDNPNFPPRISLLQHKFLFKVTSLRKSNPRFPPASLAHTPQGFAFPWYYFRATIPSERNSQDTSCNRIDTPAFACLTFALFQRRRWYEANTSRERRNRAWSSIARAPFSNGDSIWESTKFFSKEDLRKSKGDVQWTYSIGLGGFIFEYTSHSFDIERYSSSIIQLATKMNWCKPIEISRQTKQVQLLPFDRHWHLSSMMRFVQSDVLLEYLEKRKENIRKKGSSASTDWYLF